MSNALDLENIVPSVSHETYLDLEAFASFLQKCNQRINLIGRNTENDLWQRHMLDSAQLFPMIPKNAKHLVDLGSGAGFPGMVLGILGDIKVTLIESDSKKAAFLRQVAHHLKLRNIAVIESRIETLAPLDADVITARALAPLPKLFAYIHPHSDANTTLLLLKGKNYQEEIAKACNLWQFDYSSTTSCTEDDAVVLHVKHLQLRNDD